MKLDKTKPYGDLFMKVKGANVMFYGQDGYAFDRGTGEMVLDLEPQRRVTPVEIQEQTTPEQPAEEPRTEEPKTETVTCKECGKAFSVPPKAGRAAAISRVKKHLKEAHGIGD